MKLYTIDTELFKLDGGAMFGVVPKVIWNKLNPADENNLCTWAMRCLLVEDGNRLTLIDTGLGNKQDQKFFGHYYIHGDNTLEKSLARHGFSKDDVTDVILTHLHFDHCGGAIVRDGESLVPAFKNATYWSSERHWDWAAVNPNPREKASFLRENIMPIRESGQLKFIEHFGKDFPENILVRLAFGHTEAMILPQINYNGRQILYMADLIPSAAHIPVAYVMGYDMFPLTTLNEKISFLNESLQNDYVLYFEHDPSIECCTLQQTEKGIRMKDALRVTDL